MTILFYKNYRCINNDFESDGEENRRKIERCDFGGNGNRLFFLLWRKSESAKLEKNVQFWGKTVPRPV